MYTKLKKIQKYYELWHTCTCSRAKRWLWMNLMIPQCGMKKKEIIKVTDTNKYTTIKICKLIPNSHEICNLINGITNIQIKDMKYICSCIWVWHLLGYLGNVENMTPIKYIIVTQIHNQLSTVIFLQKCRRFFFYTNICVNEWIFV